MAIWYAGTHSTDSGNNTGWVFSSPSSGSLSVTLGDITVSVSGVLTHNSEIHGGPIQVVLDDLSIVFAGSVSDKKAGNGAKKRKTYIINGKRVALTQRELEAELKKAVLEAAEQTDTSEKTISVVQSEAESQVAPVEFKTIGVELNFVLDAIVKEKVFYSLKQIEAEYLGQWIEQDIRRREEEDFLMLLLAA
jgi:hypothetical protein